MIYRNESISSHEILFTFIVKIGDSGTNLLYPIFFKMSSRCVQKDVKSISSLCKM